MDVATHEVKDIFEAHFAGRATPTNKKPSQEVALEGWIVCLFVCVACFVLFFSFTFSHTLIPHHTPTLEYGLQASRAREEQLSRILRSDPTAEIPADLLESWPLHEGLRATQQLRRARLDALEVKRQAFNSKLKMLKQSQSNLALLRERRMGISRVIQDLQAQIAAAEKQLNVIEVEEFRAQRDTDELKAEYANESDQLGKLQRAKDKILQVTTPVVNHWHDWLSWSTQQPLSEFTPADVITLLAQLGITFDVDAAIKLGLDGKALLAATPALLKDQLKVIAFGDRWKVRALLDKARGKPTLDLGKDPVFAALSEQEKGAAPSDQAPPRDWHLLHPQEWRPLEVAEWVAETETGGEELREAFLREKICGAHLLALRDEDLRDVLEVASGEHRGQLLELVRNLVAGVSKRKAGGEDEARGAKRPKAAGAGGEGGDSVPREFICSLTHRLMADPVLATDGHTYERTAIEQWLERSDLSPTTKQPIPSKVVFPNHSLKSLIEDYLAGRRSR